MIGYGLVNKTCGLIWITTLTNIAYFDWIPNNDEMKLSID